MSIFKAAIASTLSLALLASQLSPAAAAPLPTNVATMKSIAANGPVQVHWHGGWGWGVGAGFLAGRRHRRRDRQRRLRLLWRALLCLRISQLSVLWLLRAPRRLLRL